MKTLTLEDMRQLRTMTRAERQAHSCRESQLDGLNLDGLDLSGLVFSWSDFRHVSFIGACLQDTDLSDTLFTDCSLAVADLSGADLHGAALRGCDLNHAVIKGANLYRANLEGARLDAIVDDESITTKGKQILCLSDADVELIKNKKIVIVDDVISTGGSLKALEELAEKAGAEVIGKAAILAEGDAGKRTDIIFLEKLPLFEAR